MSDLPKSIEICEKGPREGIQIEPGPIPTSDKIALIDALADTGIKHIQIVSFVNPKRVPTWADADAVVAGITPRPGVHYSSLWLNAQGLERALAFQDRLSFREAFTLDASEQFSLRNLNRDLAANLIEQRQSMAILKKNGIRVESGLISAAFGCNFQGDISIEQVLTTVQIALDLGAEFDVPLKRISLNDTMAWATPESVKRVVYAVRNRWPTLKINLHFHNTRGMGVANVYAGMELGVDNFDSSVAGLGGCPFAGHRGAAGNVCTEDIVFLCEELGIETGIDLDRLILVAQQAETVVGHSLPGSVMKGGTLRKLRQAVSERQAAAMA